MNCSKDYRFCQMCDAQTREDRLMQVAKIVDVLDSQSIEKLVFYFRILKFGSPSKDNCSTSECSVWQPELDESICLECTNVLSSLMQFSTRKAKNKRLQISQQGSRHEERAPDNVEQSTKTSELPQTATREKLGLSAQANPLQFSTSGSLVGDFQHNVQHQDLLLQLSSDSTVAKAPSSSKMHLSKKTEKLQKAADNLSTDSTHTKVVDNEPFPHSSPVTATCDSVGSPTDKSPLSPSLIYSPSGTSLTEEASAISPKLNQTQSPLKLSPKRSSPRLQLFKDSAIDTPSFISTSAKILKDHELKKIVNSSPAKYCDPDQITPDVSDSDSWMSTSSHDISFRTEYSDGSITAPQNSPIVSEEESDRQSSIDGNKQELKSILKSNEFPSPRSSRNIQFDPVKSIRLIFDEETSSEDEESDDKIQNDNPQQKNVSILETNITPESKNVTIDSLDKSFDCNVETESSHYTEKVTVSLSSNKNVRQSSRTNRNYKRKLREVQDSLCSNEVVADKSYKNANDEVVADKSYKNANDEVVADKSYKNANDEVVADKSYKNANDEVVADKSYKNANDEVVADKSYKDANDDDASLDLKLPSTCTTDNDVLKSSVDAKRPSKITYTSPTRTIPKAKKHHPVKNLGLRNVKAKIDVSDNSGQNSTQMESSMDSVKLRGKSKRHIPQSKAPESDESSHFSKLDLMPDNGNLVESNCDPDLPKIMFGSEYVLIGKDLGYVSDGVEKVASHIFRSYVDMGVRCDEMLPSVTTANDKKSVPSTKTKRKIVDSNISSKSKKKKY